MNDTNAIQEKLNKVVGYLNKNFNQSSGNYSISEGARPQVIRLDNETAISTWACGAVVCIGSTLYFVEEDDGHWFYELAIPAGIGFQQHFAMGWVQSFIHALDRLLDYVKENGVPLRAIIDYDPQDAPIYGNICNWRLE